MDQYLEDTVSKYYPVPQKTIHDIMDARKALKSSKALKKHKLKINYTSKPDLTRTSEVKQKSKALNRDREEYKRRD